MDRARSVAMRRAWPRRLLRATLIMVGVLFALLMALVIAIASFDWNRARPWLAEKVAEATGRSVELRGDLSVSWEQPPEARGWWRYLPWPHLRAQDVALGNPDWAASGPWMATVPQLDFSLNLPALARHELRIEQARLAGPTIVFEKAGEERRNWVFTPVHAPDNNSRWRFDITSLAIASGTLRYLDKGKATDLTLALDTAADGSVRWQATGRYNDESLRGHGLAGSLLALRGSDSRYPVEADVTIGDTQVRAHGTVTDPASPSALDIRLEISGASMADLYPISGLLLPKTPTFSTSGRVVGRIVPGSLDLRYEHFSGKVGQSDIAGTLRYRQQPRALLSGSVVSNHLRLVDLGRLIGAGDNAKAGAGDIAQPKGRVLPVSPFKTERWHRMDVDVRFTGRQIIRRAALPIEDLDTQLAMKAGVLTLDPLRFGIAGGRLQGSVRIDGLADPAQGSLRLNAQGLELKQLFPKVGNAPASVGRLVASAALKGRGNSVAALLGTSSGEVSAVISEGSVSKFVLEAAGLNIASAALTKFFGDQQVPINCLVADMTVNDGIAKPRTFLLDTRDASIGVTGTISLQGERYDLTLHPDSKGLRIVSLRSPLYIRGSFEKPEVGLDRRTVALKAGAATVIGALAAPVAGLIALISPGEKRASPCAELLSEAKHTHQSALSTLGADNPAQK